MQAQEIVKQAMTNQEAAPQEAQAPRESDGETMEIGQPQQDDTHKRLEYLTKKEREIIQKEKSIKDYEKSIEEKYKGYMSEADLKAQLDADPIAFISKHGYSLEKLADRVLGEEEKPAWQKEIEELKKELEGYKGFQEEIKTKEQLALEKEREEALIEFKSGIKSQVEVDQEKYPMLFVEKENSETIDLVMDCYEELYKANIESGMDQQKAMPDMDKVLGMVENYYKENVKKYFENPIIQKMFREHLNISESKNISTPESQFNPRKALSTLSNDFTATTNPEKPRIKSREESLAEAAKLLRYT